jgi:hypothetical protein
VDDVVYHHSGGVSGRRDFDSPRNVHIANLPILVFWSHHIAAIVNVRMPQCPYHPRRRGHYDSSWIVVVATVLLLLRWRTGYSEEPTVPLAVDTNIVVTKMRTIVVNVVVVVVVVVRYSMVCSCCGRNDLDSHDDDDDDDDGAWQLLLLLLLRYR